MTTITQIGDSRVSKRQKVQAAEVEDAQALQRFAAGSIDRLLGRLSPDAIARVQELDQEFAALGRKTAQVVFAYGEIFWAMREILGPQGLYREWLALRGIDDSTANRYLNVYRRFKDDRSQIEIFGSSSIIQILAKPSTPDEAIEEVKELVQSGAQVTAQKVAAVVDRHRDGGADLALEEVVELYAPWGEFKRVANRRFRYCLEVPPSANRQGKTVHFVSLKEAVDRHASLCRDANRKDAPPVWHSCHECAKKDPIVTGYRCGARGFEFEIAGDRDWAQENGGVCRHYQRMVFGRLSPEAGGSASVAAFVAPSIPHEQAGATEAAEETSEPIADREFQGQVKRLLAEVKLEGTVLECWAQDDSIGLLLPGRVMTNAIEPPIGFSPDFQLDLTSDAAWGAISATQSIDWVVSRAHFRAAEATLKGAIEVAQEGVALLIDYGALCSGSMEWLNQYSDRLMCQIVTPRKAWLVWGCGWSWQKLGVAAPFSF